MSHILVAYGHTATDEARGGGATCCLVGGQLHDRYGRRIASATIALIKRMALKNRLWRAERIRGELVKLGIRVSKRTVQKYMRLARGPQPWGQSWATFLSNHTHQIWACEFLQTYDVLFRPIFAFFIVEHGSRKVVHVGVTRAPASAWTAQQLREATPFSAGRRFIIRDDDDKYGVEFDRVAKTSGIRVRRAASSGAGPASAECRSGDRAHAPEGHG